LHPQALRAATFAEYAAPRYSGRHGMISIAASSLAPTGLQTVLQIFAKNKGDYCELDRRIPLRTE
jgi:hypothetical protein